MSYISDRVMPLSENTYKQRKREIILSKTNHRCAYCGIHQDDLKEYLFLDHMTPRKKGGDNRIGNLIAACRTCNNRKSKKTVKEFREYLYDGMEGKVKKAINHADMYAEYMTRPAYQNIVDSLVDALLTTNKQTVTFYMDTLDINNEVAE